MLAIAQLRQIAHQMNRSGLHDIEIVNNHCRVRLRRDAPHPVMAAPIALSSPPPAGATITAPGPGIIWFSHPLNDQPLSKPGDTVVSGDVVALLGIGHLLLPVRAPASGVVQQPCLTNGCVVEYGTELITLSQQP